MRLVSLSAMVTPVLDQVPVAVSKTQTSPPRLAPSPVQDKANTPCPSAPIPKALKLVPSAKVTRSPKSETTPLGSICCIKPVLRRLYTYPSSHEGMNDPLDNTTGGPPRLMGAGPSAVASS